MRPFKFEQDLNAYAASVHQLNAKWWHDAEGNRLELDKGERFMLMITELAEGMEGARKNLRDDHLPQYPMLWVELADCVIRVLDSGHVYGWDFSKQDEWVSLIEYPKTIGAHLLNIANDLCLLASAEIDDADDDETSGLASWIIRQCVRFAEQNGCTDFWQVVYDKLVFNVDRPDHKHENRALPGGKAW